MWEVSFNAEVESDVADAAAWYESKRTGLGREFLTEVLAVWHDLADNPLLGARKHPTKHIRWRSPPRFPYRVVYEIDETKHIVVVLAVLHAARSDLSWRPRVRP